MSNIPMDATVRGCEDNPLMRRGSKKAWQATDLILLDGEIGLEEDTCRIKIGDGWTPWSELPYIMMSIDQESIAQE